MESQKHILDRPYNGWSMIMLGEWYDRCTYIDDIPFLLLGAVKDVIATEKPVALEFDAEGYEYIIVFGSRCSYVIEEGLGGVDEELVYVPIGIEDIARMLIADINNDLDDWVSWIYPSLTEASAAEREYRLKVELASVELMLRNRAFRRKRDEEAFLLERDKVADESDAIEKELDELNDLLSPAEDIDI